MLRNKFNLFLLNLILYLLYSVAANEYSEEEYEVPSSKNELNQDRESKANTSSSNLWRRNKLAQINECQNKIFGKEKEIKRFYFNEKIQKAIIDDYINENFEFKQAYKRYRENSIIDDYINENFEFKQAYKRYRENCRSENEMETMIYVYNPEESSEKICDLLLFRLLLEFFKLMTEMDDFLKFLYLSTKTNYLEAKKEYIKLANDLIKLFEKYNKTPKEFYNLNLNGIYSENTKKTVTGKVEKFIKNYIDGKLNVVVGHLVVN
uniref:Uncharacterized protein n=1 Tax=Meloidogyne floridensis TaxID=298350 RepID=A0A915P9H1_9BILA